MQFKLTEYVEKMEESHCYRNDLFLFATYKYLIILQMKVIAMDGGHPPKSGDMDLTILIQDTNDNAPVFDNSTYEVEVFENIPFGTSSLRSTLKIQILDCMERSCTASHPGHRHPTDIYSGLRTPPVRFL